jgi:hypothetical protein
MVSLPHFAMPHLREETFQTVAAHDMKTFALKSDTTNCSQCLEIGLRTNASERRFTRIFHPRKQTVVPANVQVHLLIFGFDMILTSAHISEYSANVHFPEVKGSSISGEAALPYKNCRLEREMQDLDRSIKSSV